MAVQLSTSEQAINTGSFIADGGSFRVYTKQYVKYAMESSGLPANLYVPNASLKTVRPTKLYVRGSDGKTKLVFQLYANQNGKTVLVYGRKPVQLPVFTYNFPSQADAVDEWTLASKLAVGDTMTFGITPNDPRYTHWIQINGTSVYSQTSGSTMTIEPELLNYGLDFRTSHVRASMQNFYTVTRTA